MSSRDLFDGEIVQPLSVVALDRVREYREQRRSLEPTEEYKFLVQALSRVDWSFSQLSQDLWVLYEFGDKQGGYFVEFGAGDGVYLSNTYLLENRFAWRGILAEPNAGFHESLRMRRAIVSEDCVAARSGDIICFNHTADPHLSTIDEFTCADSHATARQSGLRAGVRTVSLNDLLDRHRAPMIIDYLSIDTEGSEMLILESFDFSHRRFALITVEHNFSPSRQAIHDLLSRHGYRRKFEKHSRFDDWYVHDEALATLRLS